MCSTDICAITVVGSNLPKVEWTATIHTLATKADKGDSVVVLTTFNYLGPGLFTPDHKNSYQLIRLNPIEEIFETFREYLKTCKGKGVTTMVQFKR